MVFQIYRLRDNRQRTLSFGVLCSNKSCWAIKFRGGSVKMHIQKRILVAGGAGFLGSHLCERLLQDGANVICVDNFFPACRPTITSLLQNSKFELIRPA